MPSLRTPCGITGLDELTLGGFPRGTVNLVSGPTGSGKSLLAIHFLCIGAEEGERGLLVSLEENRKSIERSGSDYGLDLRGMQKKGLLSIVDLAEIRKSLPGPKRAVSFADLEGLLEGYLKRGDFHRLVIDSVAAVGLYYKTIEELRQEYFVFTQFLRDKDITSVLITESIEGGSLTRFGIEQFLADSFVVLGLDELKGQLRRTITVRKMRYTRHSTTKHPLFIGDRGMEVSAEEKVIE